MASDGGQLNPEWVEKLMGWPKNWTCLDPINRLDYALWFMGTTDETKRYAYQVLQGLWCGALQEDIQRAVGRYVGVFEARALFSRLWKYKNEINQTRVFMEGAQVFETSMRGLRGKEAASRSPHRPGHNEQRRRQHTDALHVLSRLLAQTGRAGWQNGSWEDGSTRVIHGLAHRVDRIKALGNGQVPRVEAAAWHLLRL